MEGGLLPCSNCSEVQGGEGGLLPYYSSSICSEVQGGGGRFIGMI